MIRLLSMCAQPSHKSWTNRLAGVMICPHVLAQTPPFLCNHIHHFVMHLLMTGQGSQCLEMVDPVIIVDQDWDNVQMQIHMIQPSPHVHGEFHPMCFRMGEHCNTLAALTVLVLKNKHWLFVSLECANECHHICICLLFGNSLRYGCLCGHLKFSNTSLIQGGIRSHAIRHLAYMLTHKFFHLQNTTLTLSFFVPCHIVSPNMIAHLWCP